MGCILALVGMMMPRLVLFCIAVFTDWISAAYETTIWPLLGWFFMPYTTLAYLAAMLNNNHQINAGWMIVLIIAVLFDLGTAGGSAKSRSKS